MESRSWVGVSAQQLWYVLRMGYAWPKPKTIRYGHTSISNYAHTSNPRYQTNPFKPAIVF